MGACMTYMLTKVGEVMEIKGSKEGFVLSALLFVLEHDDQRLSSFQKCVFPRVREHLFPEELRMHFQLHQKFVFASEILIETKFPKRNLGFFNRQYTADED